MFIGLWLTLALLRKWLKIHMTVFKLYEINCQAQNWHNQYPKYIYNLHMPPVHKWFSFVIYVKGKLSGDNRIGLNKIKVWNLDLQQNFTEWLSTAKMSIFYTIEIMVKDSLNSKFLIWQFKIMVTSISWDFGDHFYLVVNLE